MVLFSRPDGMCEAGKQECGRGETSMAGIRANEGKDVENGRASFTTTTVIRQRDKWMGYG